jgi:hypothetical protein
VLPVEVPSEVPVEPVEPAVVVEVDGSVVELPVPLAVMAEPVLPVPSLSVTVTLALVSVSVSVLDVVVSVVLEVVALVELIVVVVAVAVVVLVVVELVDSDSEPDCIKSHSDWEKPSSKHGSAHPAA